ncbi:MAG: ricin-type beta-trefoil lectin domain protein [Anaerolineae bacterium]|nr:ricin-type beta-trefoil lectin domain protein [Anaerolineae bacterium]
MKLIYPIGILILFSIAIGAIGLMPPQAAAQSASVTINGLAPVQQNLVCGQTFDVQVNVTNQGSGTSAPGVVTLQSIHRGTGNVLFTGQANYPSIPPRGNYVVPMRVRIDRYYSRGQQLVASTNGQTFRTNYDIRQGNCSRNSTSGNNNDNDVYAIQARHSGKCLDVQGDNRNNGAVIQQFSCNGGQNQQWILRPAGNGFYNLVSRSSNRCLDIRAASRDDRVPAQLFSCNNGDNQRFQLRHVGSSFFNLVAKHSGKCLDVRGNDTDNRAIVQQFRCTGSQNQQWQLR